MRRDVTRKRCQLFTFSTEVPRMPTHVLRPSIRMASMVMAALLAAVLAVTATPIAFAQKLVQIPTITQRVSDNVALLSEQDEGQVNALLKRVEEQQGTRIMILSIASTASETIDEFSARVVASWQPTHPGRAVFIVVARDNRPDAERIAIVGMNGAEKALDQTSVARITGEDMLPRFRLLEYRSAFEAGIADVVLLLKGEALPPAVEEKSLVQDGPRVDPVLIGAAGGAILVLLFLLWIVMRVQSRRLLYLTGNRSLNRSFEPMIVGSIRKPAPFDPETGNGFGGGFGAERGFTSTRRDFGGNGSSGAWPR
jgi:uncharacterized protein